MQTDLHRDDIKYMLQEWAKWGKERWVKGYASQTVERSLYNMGGASIAPNIDDDTAIIIDRAVSSFKPVGHAERPAYRSARTLSAWHVIQFYYHGGMSYARIAGFWQCGTTTVENRMNEALDLIESYLSTFDINGRLGV